jgi:hypothetical protein
MITGQSNGIKIGQTEHRARTHEAMTSARQTFAAAPGAVHTSQPELPITVMPPTQHAAIVF